MSPVASFCVPLALGVGVTYSSATALAEDLSSQYEQTEREDPQGTCKGILASQRATREREVLVLHLAWFVAPRSSLNMDIRDQSDDEGEEQGRYATSSSGRPGSSLLGARRRKRRSGGGSHQHLLLMDCVGGSRGGGGDGDGAVEDAVPLPDYERLLSQSVPLHDGDSKNPPLALLAAEEEQQQQQQKAPASPPQPPPPPVPQQQKPAAWRLIEYVRSRNRSSGAAGVGAGGCGAGSDGDSKSSEDGEDGGGGEEGKKDKKKKKKRSSWLPDPDRRWPVQGFY